tara:strand:- start:387 stop:866 length:480 start_codon:yes stop_codon:yes gene_type:complete
MDSKQIFKAISSIDGVDLNLESDFISVSSVSLLAVAEKFTNDLTLDFDFLMCITALDDGNSKNFTVAYNFHSNKNNHSIEVRVSIADGEDVPSIAGIWKTADWHEREAYDMMGINFSGHPDLKRILLPEDWEGFPLRKDYEVADYYHGVPIPKDKSYWE